jgi:O-antigen/teichoic acid export membrane protein
VIVYREAARRPRLIAPLTDLLIGLRGLAALIGYAVVLILAVLVGQARGQVVAVSGLLLVTAVGMADVGPRATGRLGWVAAAQVLRSVGYLTAVVLLIGGPLHDARAAACLVAAEGLAVAVVMGIHARTYRPAWPCWRGRASRVLAYRGAIAGLTRFGRVTVYGLDMLALGWWLGPELGPYAAARRLVFALLALGLVVPATLGPAIGRAWSSGTVEARRSIVGAMDGLWSLAAPAALGLLLTADRLMPALFGEGYRDGGAWLVLVAARLPLLLSGSFAQATLVACRRESWCLRLVAGQLALAAVVVPPAAAWAGPWGVGLAALAIEVVGAVSGWIALARLGVVERLGLPPVAAVAGCLALVAACRLTNTAPIAVTCLAAAVAYGAVWWGLSRSCAFRRPEAGVGP